MAKIFDIGPHIGQLETDIGNLRGYATRDVRDPRLGTQLLLDDLGVAEQMARGNLGSQIQGDFQGAQDQIAMAGGLSKGAGERLARRGLDTAARARQDLSRDFTKLNVDTRAQDLLAQEAQKFQATQLLPAHSRGVADLRLAEAAANQEAEALKKANEKANKKGIFSTVLGAAGGIVGGIYGGPAGASAGASIGSSVGGLFG